MPRKFSTEEELWKWLDSAEKKNAPYMFALGNFISMFSALEAKLQAALWKFAGVSPPERTGSFQWRARKWRDAIHKSTGRRPKLG
jgi:hypothetical protein